VNEEFAKALVAIQKEMPAIEKDGKNPHFRSEFVTLDNLLAKALPVCNRHGVVVAQFPTVDNFEGSRSTLTTVLIHESGEQLSYVMPLLLDKPTPQGQGSAITYARRYALAAALGISSEKDDDGNAATQQSTGEVATPSHVAEPRGAAAQEAPSPVGSTPSQEERQKAWIAAWDSHGLKDLKTAIASMAREQVAAGFIMESERANRGKDVRKTVQSALRDRINVLDALDGVDQDLGGEEPQGTSDTLSPDTKPDDPGSSESASDPPKELLLVKAALAWIADQPESVDNANAWTQTGILLGISQLPPENTHLGTYASLEEVPVETLQWIWESAVPDPVTDAVLRLGPEQLAALAGQAK
jgi:hypothetical protein